MSDKFFTKGIYSSGMVLQQNTINCIFGCGIPGKSVTLEFNNFLFQAVADDSGNWKIEYPVGEAGGPFVIKLSSENDQIVFDDVWAGEVWVNSGQSNAQLPMERMKFSYPQEFDLPKNNNIRMITVPISYSFDGEQDSVENPVWKVASPETLGEMSGTGYFFAKKLSEELKVPVGIINASQGGSPISAWMNKDTLLKTSNMQRCLDELEKWENPVKIEEKKQEMQKNQSEWDAEINRADEGLKNHWENLAFDDVKNVWQDVFVPGDIDVLKSAGIIWLKKEIELSENQIKLFNENGCNLWLGTILDADRAYVNGIQVGVTYYTYPPRRYSIPEGILKAGKNTITMRIQKNSAIGPVRLYKEKPYCLFSNRVKVTPCVSKNVEKKASDYITCWNDDSAQNQDEFINLYGEWKMEIGAKVRDCPSGMFFEWVPTALYNAMLAPCFNYAVAGALWYQGESDAYQPEAYKELLTNLIYLWRNKFSYSVNGMPFVVMQLPNWCDGNKADFISDGIGWPKMRFSQALVSKEVCKCGLAVNVDGGEWNDLHPEKKQTGGFRAAGEALRVAYSKNILPAPEAVFVEMNNDTVLVQFDNCGSGLQVKERNDNVIPGFYFVLKDSNKIVETSGTLVSGTEVKVKIPDDVCEELKELRYLWSDCPEQIVLYSSEDLPAAPFLWKF